MVQKQTLTHENIVEFIGDIFARCGDEEYLGEPVTMGQHMFCLLYTSDAADE